MYILEQLGVCAIVCLAKILEISIQSVKTVCMVKGQKVVASFLGFIECLVWGLVISSVITSLSGNLFLLISYCFGYASGLYLGSIIENKIALGTSSIQIMVNKKYISDVEKYLKESNRGFTIVDGHGSKEEMSIVIMVLPRKDSKNVMSEISKICENNVFVVASEVSKFVGGYGVKK